MQKLLWQWFGVVGLAMALAGCGQTSQNLATQPDVARAEATALVVTTQDLGTFGATYSIAYSINNRGQIVGIKGIPDLTSAFLLDKGTAIDLGSFGGSFTRPFAINNRGQVVGESIVASDGSSHPFLWSAQTGMVDLGTFGGPTSQAFAINERGQVVGYSDNFPFPFPTKSAFLWSQQTGMLNLGEGEVRGINNLGQVVGNLSGRVVLWNSPTNIIDLGAPEGFSSMARDINDRGQVVGYRAIGTSFPNPYVIHAFIWTSRDGMKDLGTLGGNFSLAYAINSKGQVVGSSETATGELHAFFWSESTGMIDLTPNGGDNNEAYDINDRSQAVGYIGSFASAGQDVRATLWTIR